MENIRMLRKGRGQDRYRPHYREPKEQKKVMLDPGQNNQKPLQSTEGWILFISNLHEETSEDDIKEAFSEYGDVKNINLNLDRRTGFVKGYALVEYDTYQQASTAREAMNNSELLEMTVKVDWCFVQTVKI